MHRFQVIEAFPDGDTVKLQPLSVHASYIGMYWWYTLNAGTELTNKRLHVIDIKLQKHLTWLDVQKYMFHEALVRIFEKKRIADYVADALRQMGYIGIGQNITNKGFELIAELSLEEITISLGHIETESKLYLG